MKEVDWGKQNEGYQRTGTDGVASQTSDERIVLNASYLAHNLAEVGAERDAQTRRTDGRGGMVVMIQRSEWYPGCQIFGT